MEAAITNKNKGLQEGGIPIGSVLVKDGFLARHNVCKIDDPSRQREIDCLRKYWQNRLQGDTTLYSAVMPCYPLLRRAVIQLG